MTNVTIPPTGSGSATPIVSTDVVTADTSNVQNVQLTSVAAGVLTRLGTVGSPLEVAIVGTVPISGAPTTVTANIGTSGSLGLDTSLQSILTKLNASIGVTGTFWQATQPVSGTFWQATQPVSGTVTANLGTLNGAATAAKQPALGTAGSASTDVITIQGIASGVAIPVTGGGVPTDLTATGSLTGTGTVTISGMNSMSTVMAQITGGANATFAFEGTVDGTNWQVIPYAAMNSPTSTWIITAGTTSATSVYEAQISGLAGVRINVNSYVSGTVGVAMRASNGMLTRPNVAIVANSAINVAQINGLTPSMGHGTAGTASLRVELPTDGTGVVGLGTAVLAAAAQVSVTATAGTLLAAGTYKSIGLRNLSTSASSVFIGPATVTATTGMEIKPGEFYGYGPGECPSNLIQAICAGSGTATVIVQTAS